MKPNYSTPTQNNPPIYTQPPMKPVSQIPQPRLSHNPGYTNSTKDIGGKKQEYKDPKYTNSVSPNVTPTHKKYNRSPPSETEPNKNVPSFIENKNGSMKGSMYVGDAQLEATSKYPKHEQTVYTSIIPDKPKRLPRMSEANYPQMIASNIEFNNESKVPAFLQEKQEKSAKKDDKSYGKKIPYTNDANQRPQSSKQMVNKFKDGIGSTQGSFSSSFGMRQSKMQPSDPTSEWVKKSWSKKKQRKIQINDFQQIQELGSGKYGQVFLAREKKTNFICALKIVEKQLLREQQITEQFIRELKIQSYLNHPNIIRMFGYFDDAVNIYIILEVGTGGQLFKQLKKHQCMSEAKVAATMRQVCQAINELHSNRIIHRDIKPENIVLHDNVVKLCDFGWSVHRDESMRKTFCGTPLYVCPEILRGNEYDEKIDIWSLGVMMYEMMVGENPFKITKEEQLVKIIKDAVNIPSYVEISPEGQSFLGLCLQKNPEQRANIRELLNHDFFKKYPDKNDKKVGF